MLDLLCNTPSEVDIGKHRVSVAALTLYDLGRLQRYIRDHAPRPRDVARAALAHHPAEEHRRLLYEADLAERHFPPVVGTEEGTRVLLSSTEGVRFFLDVMLRPTVSSLDGELLDSIMEEADEHDFALLTLVAFEGVRTSVDQIREEARARRRPDPPDFGKLYIELITKEPHWTFEEISKLTLPQLLALSTGGKPPARTRAMATPGRVNQVVREAAAKADPNAPPPPPDKFREWAEKSLGVKTQDGQPGPALRQTAIRRGPAPTPPASQPDNGG